MSFRRIDAKMVEGHHLWFEDKGPVSVGAKTRLYVVKSRINQTTVGHVRFFPQWREYIFYPLHSPLRACCSAEIAEFCIEATAANRAKRKPFPASE